jgi:hypothetical protein
MRLHLARVHRSKATGHDLRLTHDSGFLLIEMHDMKFLVEMDHSKTGPWLNPAETRAFAEQVIFPSLDRAEALVKQGCILAGGPVAGSVALRFIAEVQSAQHLDELISSIPLWSVAYTRVTPLIEFGDRRPHVLAFLQQPIIPLPNLSAQPV